MLPCNGGMVMASMKEVSVERGESLCDLVAKVRLASKRAEDGAVQAAQFLRLSDDSGAEALYMVVGITATRGAVNGETTLTLARVVGDGFPPVALISSRSPAPCGVARATEGEVVGAIRLRALLSSDGVHLDPPAPRPARATRDGLRPVEFAECAPVTGRCAPMGTRGQRYEATEELETVSILTADAGAGEWERAVDAEVLATEPDAPSAEPAATEPVTETPATEPAATETEPSAEPAPVKGKRRKG